MHQQIFHIQLLAFSLCLKKNLGLQFTCHDYFSLGDTIFFSSEIAVQQLSADGFGNLRSHVFCI